MSKDIVEKIKATEKDAKAVVECAKKERDALIKSVSEQILEEKSQLLKKLKRERNERILRCELQWQKKQEEAEAEAKASKDVAETEYKKFFEEAVLAACAEDLLDGVPQIDADHEPQAPYVEDGGMPFLHFGQFAAEIVADFRHMGHHVLLHHHLADGDAYGQGGFPKYVPRRAYGYAGRAARGYDFVLQRPRNAVSWRARRQLLCHQCCGQHYAARQ